MGRSISLLLTFLFITVTLLVTSCKNRQTSQLKTTPAVNDGQNGAEDVILEQFLALQPDKIDQLINLLQQQNHVAIFQLENTIARTKQRIKLGQMSDENIDKIMIKKEILTTLAYMGGVAALTGYVMGAPLGVYASVNQGKTAITKFMKQYSLKTQKAMYAFLGLFFAGAITAAYSGFEAAQLSDQLAEIPVDRQRLDDLLLSLRNQQTKLAGLQAMRAKLQQVKPQPTNGPVAIGGEK